MKNTMYRFVLGLGLGLSVCGRVAMAQAEDTVVVKWDEVALQAIRDTHPGPPIVARMLAVTHTCMYDAWAAYDSTAKGTMLAGTLRQPLRVSNGHGGFVTQK